jgi:DNA-binding NtrC family response regulator
MRPLVTRSPGGDDVRPRDVWIVEDDSAAATLAVELCAAAGAEAIVYREPLPFLTALRGSAAPAAVVLDWRLERELSAALFMATRHVHPTVPVVYWTGSLSTALPEMIRSDAATVVVDKSGGIAPFEQAIAWALSSRRVVGDAAEDQGVAGVGA